MKSIFISSTFKDMHCERDIIQKEVIPEISMYARQFSEELRFVDLRWGVNTSNLDSDKGSKKVLSVCLDEIDNCKPYMIVLLGDRYGWVPEQKLIENSVKHKKFKITAQNKSVTALEIEYGALKEDPICENTLFFFRDPISYQNMEQNELCTYKDNNEQSYQNLIELKNEILQKFGDKTFFYTPVWDKSLQKFVELEDFANQMIKALKALFDKEFTHRKNLTWQQKELIESKLFIENKSRQFAARLDLIKNYKQQVLDINNNLIVIKGSAGVGKSTLISKLYKELSSSGIDVFAFICGNSSNSSTLLNMLEQIVYYIEEKAKLKHFTSINSDDTLKAWVDRFYEVSYLYAQKTNNNLVILCDALDQLFFEEALYKYTWLPIKLPQNVKIVVTHIDTFDTTIPINYQKKCFVNQIENLETSEKHQIIKNILKAYGKEIDKCIIDAILTKDGSNNPLYLSLLLQIFIMFDNRDFNEIDMHGANMDSINEYMLKIVSECPQTLTQMAATIMIKAAEHINSMQSIKILEYFAFSRQGLREYDLEQIFANKGINWSALDLSRLIKYMSNFFVIRDDGRIDFTHKSIRQGLIDAFLTTKEQINLDILNHLKALNVNDDVREKEITYHAYLADDKLFVANYFDNILSNSKAAQNFAGREIVKISLADNAKWFNSLLLNAIDFKCFSDFIIFCNYDLMIMFDKSASHMLISEKIASQLLKLNIDMDKILNTQTSKRCLSVVYNRLGDILRAQGKLNEAIINYSHSGKIRDALTESEDSVDYKRDLAISFSNMGDIFFNQSKYTEALDFQNRSIHILNEIFKTVKNPIMARSLVNIYDRGGFALEKLNRFDEALQYFEYSHSLNKRLYDYEKTPVNHRHLSLSYNNMAGILLAKGDVDSAFVNYSKGLEISLSLYAQLGTAEATRDLMVSYTRLFHTLMAKKSTKDAEKYVFDALNLSIKLKNDLQTPDSIRDLGILYQNIARLYLDKEENEKALDYYSKMLELCITLDKKLYTLEISRILASSHDGISSVYLNKGEFNNALTECQRAYKIRQKNYDEIVSLDTIRDLAVTFFHLAKIYEKLDNHRKALANYKLYIKKHSEAHLKYKTSQTFLDLATAYRNFGDYLSAQNHITQAIKYYDKCIDIGQQLTKNINRTDTIFTIATIYTSIADTLIDNDYSSKSEKFLTASLDLLNKFDATNDFSGLKSLIWLTNIKMAELSLLQKNVDEYIVYYDTASNYKTSDDPAVLELRYNIIYNLLLNLKNYKQHTNCFDDFFNICLMLVDEFYNLAFLESSLEDADNLAKIFKETDDETALKFYHHAAILSQKIKDADKTEEINQLIFTANYSLAYFLFNHDKNAESLPYLIKSYEVIMTLKELTPKLFFSTVSIPNLIAAIYEKTVAIKDINKAIEYYKLGIKNGEIYAKAQDTAETYSSLAKDYLSLINIFKNQEMFDEMLANQIKVSKVFKKITLYTQDIQDFNNEAISYTNIAESYKQNNNLPLAVSYYLKSIECREVHLTTGKAYVEFVIAHSTNHYWAGKCLAALEEFEQAEEHFDAHILLNEQIFEFSPTIQTKSEQLWAYGRMGEFYEQWKKHEQALEKYLHWLKLTEEAFGTSIDDANICNFIATICDNISRNYAALDKKEDAKIYSEKSAKLIALRESL